MNTDTNELIKLRAGEPILEGIEPLPAKLQPDARRLMKWSKKRRKKRRKAAKASRRKNRG